MSDYFVSSNYTITAGTRARASAINEITTALNTGLALLPTEANIKRGLINYAVDSGAADAYVVTLPYTPAAYTDGMQVVFKASAVNTGACTINVDSLGVKSIKRQDGSAPVAGDIGANKITELRYNTTSGYFEIQGSIGAAAGTGTMASQNSNAVAISGGTTAGLVDTGSRLNSSNLNEAVALVATSTEINNIAVGAGVTIPRQVIKEIGDWNMDSTETVSVAHGLTITKIVGVRVLIQNDNSSALYSFTQHYYPTTVQNQGGTFAITTTNVELYRFATGVFDHSLFDSTSFNRGWIILDHIT